MQVLREHRQWAVWKAPGEMPFKLACEGSFGGGRRVPGRGVSLWGGIPGEKS